MPTPVKIIGGIGAIVVGAVTGFAPLTYAGIGLFASGVQDLIGIRDDVGLDARQQGNLVGARDTANAPIPLVYGSTKLSLVLDDIRVDGASTSDLYVVGVLAHGSRDGYGIAAIDEIYFDDRNALNAAGTPQTPFTATNVKVAKLLGSATQSYATASINSTNLDTLFGVWTSSDAGAGLAGLVR
jgi:hypothetical protein